MRVLLIGAFTPANLGDGAIVSSMIHEVRRVFGSGTEVAVSATDPDAFRDLLGIDACERLIPWEPLGSWSGRLRWLTLRASSVMRIWIACRSGRSGLQAVLDRSAPASHDAALREFLAADLVIAVGGGYLADAYRKQFPFWYLEYLCARAAGAPLVFFSQSFGPARSRTSRYFLRRALAMSSLFIARDHQSCDHLRSLGADMDKVGLCPDVALTAPRLEGAPSGPPTLGVSLLKWANYEGDAALSHRRYLDALESALVVRLRKDPQTRVRLYATNSALGRNAMDDVAVCNEMRDRLIAHGLGERCSVAPWTAQAAEYCSDVAQCQLLVASRMHSAVLALTQGVPVAGIAYEEKMFGLLRLLDLENECVDIENPDDIERLIEQAWLHRDLTRAAIASRLETVVAHAASAMESTRDIYLRHIALHDGVQG